MDKILMGGVIDETTVVYCYFALSIRHSLLKATTTMDSYDFLIAYQDGNSDAR